MTLDQKRKEIVVNVVKRLKNDGNASEYIQKILVDPQFKLWLDTWVIFPLETAAMEIPKDDYLAKKNFEAGLSMSR
jgi:hypothetical protein